MCLFKLLSCRYGKSARRAKGRAFLADVLVLAFLGLRRWMRWMRWLRTIQTGMCQAGSSMAGDVHFYTQYLHDPAYGRWPQKERCLSQMVMAKGLGASASSPEKRCRLSNLTGVLVMPPPHLRTELSRLMSAFARGTARLGVEPRTRQIWRPSTIDFLS